MSEIYEVAGHRAYVVESICLRDRTIMVVVINIFMMFHVILFRHAKISSCCIRLIRG